MPYALDDKITTYLQTHGVTGARMLDAVIVLPTETGELHRRVSGVITSAKLDAIIAEHKSLTQTAA